MKHRFSGTGIGTRSTSVDQSTTKQAAEKVACRSCFHLRGLFLKPRSASLRPVFLLCPAFLGRAETLLPRLTPPESTSPSAPGSPPWPAGERIRPPSPPRAASPGATNCRPSPSQKSSPPACASADCERSRDDSAPPPAANSETCGWFCTRLHA